MKNVFIGQAFMIPSYALIGLAIAAAPDMGLFLTLMAWSAVAMLAGGATGILWAKRISA